MLQVSTETVERLLPAVDQAIVAGDPARAEGICRQILVMVPGHARALQRLGLSLAMRGPSVEAVECFRRSLAVVPEADTWNDLGAALATLGRAGEARQAFEAGLAMNPGHLRARLGLAHVLKMAGDADPAAAEYLRAIEAHPACGEAWLELGRVFLHTGRYAEAAGPLEKAAELMPGNCEVHNDLGVAYQFSRRSAQAIAAFERSLAINPRFLAAHSNLGNEHKFQGRLGEAAESYRRALECNPQFAEVYNNLAAVLMVMARCEEAAAVYRKAIVLKPDFEAARSGYLYCLNSLARKGPAEVYREHREWEKYCGVSEAARYTNWGNERLPEKRLKVGYVSADFRGHPVGYFMENTLAGHQRNGFEVFCYAEPIVVDAMAGRLKGLADHWRVINGWSAEQVARQVREDGIDILVDLHGHTAGGRLKVFSMKPAPVQVTYLGYPGTTGLSAMDYRITDAWADPAGESPEVEPDCFYSEKLVRLKATFLCFRAPEGAPRTERRQDEGPLTFASFNALSKVSPETVAMWVGILREVPGSRLMLKTVGLQDGVVRERIVRMFAEWGIGESRLMLLPPAGTRAEHLAVYQTADIALDTIPYHGTTTTCEALYMGVPVVTLAGRVHAGRVGVSILNNVGLADLVARTAEEYQKIAVELARDVSRQAELRRTLRARMERSPLMDGEGFVGKLEGAYRAMWRNWCEQQI